MDARALLKISRRCWEVEKEQALKALANAKFVTGRPDDDAFLHLLETQYGFEFTLTPDNKDVDHYKILDNAKFTYFLLRWS